MTSDQTLREIKERGVEIVKDQLYFYANRFHPK